MFIPTSPLADISIVPARSELGGGAAVQVRTDHPLEACMASQYAGWQIAGEKKFFAMGSGPMRIARGREELFQDIELPHPECARHVVGVLESGKLPPADVCEHVARECRVSAEQLTLLIAPTKSLAGMVQVVARSVETALHKLHTVGFPLSRVASGYGVAPLPPCATDDLAAIGHTNDAVLYGGEVTLWVRGDDELIAKLGPSIPSSASKDFGRPFGEIFKSYQYDFYKIDPLLFGTAAITINNLDTGSSFHFGTLHPKAPRLRAALGIMRIAVLTSPESWYLRDLQRAAAGRHDVQCVSFQQIACRLENERQVLYAGDHAFSEFDAVLVRTMPPGSLEQVVFRMDALARHEAAGGVVLNSARAVEAAVDKFLTSARLQQVGLKTPRTVVCQTADDACAAFEQLGRDVVVKPLFGSEGRGITRVSDPDLALRAFKMLEQFGSILYLQEFIPHEGFDLRLLVIGDRVLGMRRRNALDWRTNVSRGAQTEPFAPDASLCEMAHRAAQSVGARIAGIDLLPGRDGELYAIEVNAVPGWQALARTLQVDVAALVLDEVAAACRSVQR
jgi:ribosomal protein S6--L-glutamate ligase